MEHIRNTYATQFESSTRVHILVCEATRTHAHPVHTRSNNIFAQFKLKNINNIPTCIYYHIANILQATAADCSQKRQTASQCGGGALA